jgi:prepilin-type processing-associated H-X9-DG protein
MIQKIRRVAMRVINLIIGVLVAIIASGLLLTGVQKVREAAARTPCTSNLRQIGLGFHNYEGVYNHFPLAAMANPDLPPEQRFSWLLTILPYIEADNIYSSVDKNAGWDAEQNRFAGLLSIPNFHCLSFPPQQPVTTMFPTHYVGIVGLGVDAATLPLDDPRVGCFGYDRHLTFAKMGLSKLLVAIETTRVSGAWTAGGPPTTRGIDESDPPYLGKADQFGGTHAGGANVLFGDGSVHFLRNSIASRVFTALALVHNADPIGALDEE